MDTRVVGFLLVGLILALPWPLVVEGRSLCVIPTNGSPELDTLQSQLCDEEINGMDLAIQQMSESNVTLILQPGVHRLSEFTVVESVSDISIIGNGPHVDVEITCDEGIGMLFVNVTNFTIQNVTVAHCGLLGDNLLNASRRAQEYVALKIYDLSPTVGRAIIIVQCYGLLLENVCIRNTVGVGLTGLNVLGVSDMRNVELYQNSYNRSESKSFERVAGCAMFYFGDMTANDTQIFRTENDMLHIDNCRFANSTASSGVTEHILVDDFFEINDYASQHGSTFPLDGAGGLSLIFAAQQRGHVTQRVLVTHSNFTRVNHSSGGCMLLLFQGIASGASVLLDDVVFDDCRGGNTGGGLLVGYSYPTELDSLAYAFTPDSIITQEVVLRNTVFQNCRGTWGGGVAVLSIPTFLPRGVLRRNSTRQIIFDNCTMKDNRGTTGSAIAFWEGKYHGVQKKFGLYVDLIDCHFAHNRLEKEQRPQINAAVVNLDAVSVNFRGKTSFENNRVSCIGATRSEVQVYNEFLAIGSQVIIGGALDFRDTSFLIVKEGANLTFADNLALWRGGAVSVNTFSPWPLTIFGRCFLHFENFHACPRHPCYNLSENNGSFNLYFLNNKASLFGNEIFGATLQFCPWLPAGQNGTQILEFLTSELSHILHFSSPIMESHDAINTYMSNVLFDPSTPPPQAVMPGEHWNARVTVLDFFNQTVPAVNSLRIPLGDGVIDASGNFSIDGSLVSLLNEVQDVTFSFNGTPGENLTFQFLPIYEFRPIGEFSFTFTQCKVGFVYDENLQACICDEVLLSLHQSIQCHENGTISHGPRRWIGYQNRSTENTTSYLYVTSLCVFDFCDENNIICDLSDAAEQCNHNRTGTLCGGCKEGFSRVLGSTACNKCSDATLSYILLFVISGVLVVVGIFALQISISSGYLNGPILYANIMSTYATSLFPLNTTRYENAAFVLLSFLNLDIGFETCFYDGMTQIGYTTFKLSYPIYLLLIIFGVILIAKICPNRLFRMQSLHPVQAIATVLFISFNNLYQSIVEILSPTVLTYHGPDTNGLTEHRWLMDPTVHYGQGAHGALVFVALVLLIFILVPVVIVLIFYKQLLKVKYVGRLLQKWWPFFDAFQNPYVNHLRFWIGIQLLLRAASLCIAALGQLASTKSSLRNFSVFFMVMVLITFTTVEAFLRPFKGVVRNVIEGLFLLDLVYLLTSALYYDIVSLSIQVDQADIDLIMSLHLITIQVCLYIAILLAGLIFLGFVLVRLGIVKLVHRKILPQLPIKVQDIIVMILCDAGYTQITNHKMSTSKTARQTILDATDEDDETDATSQSLQMHPQTDNFQAEYRHFRDSILEDMSHSHRL